MNRFLFLFFLLIVSYPICAQDSLKTLSSKEVIKIVQQYHPVAKQANINIKKSEADILISRGAFDPFVTTSTGSKTFNGLDYYNYVSPNITVPTWYGIEVYSGLESLSGNRLDPTETAGQTNYIGISVPLLKDLVIDKRRSALQQAKIFKLLAEAEQKSVVNSLIKDAMDAYWQWVKAYEVYGIIRNTVLVNEQRLDFVKKIVANGERPAIDTVEALAQLQSFQYELNNSLLAFQNAALQLSAYLWTSNNEPYFLPEYIKPNPEWELESKGYITNVSLPDLENAAAKSHPDLLMYNLKLSTLDIEKKLKFQELLPKLDFNYNMLGKGYDVIKTTRKAPLFENNYLYGFKFEMPLRLSKGRGEYKKAKLKIEETRLDQNQKAVEIKIKIRSYYNEILTLQKQVALQKSNYNNYQRLVTAEQTRLENGESSLFLINSRETKALEAYEKLIELKTKYLKTMVALQWSAGFP